MQTDICLKNGLSVYFIGIGGISMSGLAKILKQKGLYVAGSDCVKSDITSDLEKSGIKVNYAQLAGNIDDRYDFVVYTPAISQDNEELIRAKELKIKLINRSQLLGYIMSLYENSISVAGTHGKTTTTSMISAVLLEADCDPTISVGGILPVIGGNIRIGDSQCFITEACEYKDSFLDFNSKIGVILNIEEDHMDYFKDLNDIRSSFKKFISNINDIVVINNEIDEYEYLAENKKIITFGSGDADYSLVDLKYIGDKTNFKFKDKSDNKIYSVVLPIKGNHNVYNALAAIAVCSQMGVAHEIIIAALEKFGGPKRRFEKKGVLKGNITIIDDYAHHPSEIKASLESAKLYNCEKVVCVFQPHTFSRTKAFLKEFVEVLSLADVIVLAKIYPAREKDDLGVSSKLIADKLAELGKEAYYFDTFDEIENFLLMYLKPNDMCITMGAGDINAVGERLLL